MSGVRRGDRIRLVHHTDKWTELKPGDQGTVTYIDSLGTIHVHWDNGSRLGLIPGVDRWEAIPQRRKGKLLEFP